MGRSRSSVELTVNAMVPLLQTNFTIISRFKTRPTVVFELQQREKNVSNQQIFFDKQSCQRNSSKKCNIHDKNVKNK